MSASKDTDRRIVFLDTNLFLQCRDIKDLPWAEVFEKEDLLLLVPRVVQEEIDRQKSEGNTRRGRRARKISAFFRDIILSPQSSIVVTKGSPDITVEFACTPPPVPTEEISLLDFGHPDDRIVYEVWRYKNDHPKAEVSLLTHDTSPMLTCKKLGIAFHIIPESWLLPPEPDPRDKKIQDLEQKFRALAKTQPQLLVTIINNEGVQISSGEIIITRYSDLTNGEVDALIAEASSRSPKRQIFQDKEPPLPATLRMSSVSENILGFRWEYQKATQTKIDKYHEEYENWLEKLRNFYQKLSKSWGYNERYHEVRFCLVNNGTVPAEHIVIEFEAVGGLLIASPESVEKELAGLKIAAPSPPDAPEGRWIQRRGGFGSLLAEQHAIGRLFQNHEPILPLHHFAKSQRDRNAFYYKKGKSDGFTTFISFECEEYRHQMDPEIFELIVFVPQDVAMSSGGISCLITSRNLPCPVKAFYPIQVTAKEGNIYDVAMSLLPTKLPDILRRFQ